MRISLGTSDAAMETFTSFLASKIVGFSVASAVSLYAIWRAYLRPYLESKIPIEGVPTPPRCHWFLGHLHIYRHPFKIAMSNFLRYNDRNGRMGFWQGPSTRALVLTKPKDFKQVLHSEHRHRLVPIFKKHLTRVFGRKSIGLLGGREWKNARSNVMKSFTPSTLVYSKEAKLQVTGTLVESLKRLLVKDSVITMDVAELMKMITLDVFGLAAFSYQFKSCYNLKLSAVAESFDFLSSDISRRFNSGALKPFNFFYFLPTEANRKNTKCLASLHSFVVSAIQERREELARSNGTKSNDLLTRFVEACDSGETERCDDEMLVDSLVSLLFAGFDTTSVTLSYSLYMLSTHPEFLEASLEEIDRVGVSDVENLVFLRGTVKEVLRLFPPAFITTRCPQKPIQLHDGFTVPQDCNVIIPIWAIQRAEENFTEAETFRPDRWVQKKSIGEAWVERTDKGEGTIPAGNDDAFISFSAGARSCPGQKFAWQEAVVVLACLLKELEFRPIESYKLESERCGIVQHPKGGVPMQISLRRK